MFPVHLLENRIGSPNGVELIISVLHHPYNWLLADSARRLRNLLDRTSDMVITGHEHEHAFYTRTTSVGENSEYTEGGVLQDSDNDDASTFNVIIIDTEDRTQRSINFSWTPSEGMYLPSKDDAVRPFQRNKKARRAEFPFTEGFDKWLDDLGVVFKHPRKKELTLSDVFVYPDMREVSADDSSEEISRVLGRQCITTILKHERVLVIGGDSCGKTALAKAIVRDLRREGLIPIIVSGAGLTPTKMRNLARVVTSAVDDQYGQDVGDKYLQLDPSARAIVIDDYHRIAASTADRSAFLTELAKQFGIMVVVAGEQVRFEELAKDRADRLALWDLKHLEIMEFGLVLRSHMVRKWYALGTEASASEAKTQDELAKVEQQITAFLGGQYIPAYPIFVLAVLQTLEIQNTLSSQNGSASYLHEAVILRLLHDSTTSDADVDTNRNYLSELAYFLSEEGTVRLSIEQLRTWHEKYCREYRLSIEFSRHIKALKTAGILNESGGLISFRYSYLYYFFVARYLANNIHRDDIRAQVKVLTTFLHQEDVANIMLFLCHLSKDPLIINSIMETAESLFAAYGEANLDEDAKALNELATGQESRHLEDRSPEHRRQELLSDADERASRTIKTYDQGDYVVIIVDLKRECDIRALDDQMQLSSALKTIQIMGQIIRNHVGSLKGDVKTDLVERCYALGLRSMRCMLSVLEENVGELVASVVEAAAKREGGAPRHKIVESVNRSVWGTLRLGTLALVKYISDSIGMDKLTESYEEALKRRKTSAAQLIDISVKLDYFRGFPETESIKLVDKLRKGNNHFVFSILRDMIYMRFYLYQADYRIRQRVCEKLLIGHGAQKRIGDQRGKQKGKGGGPPRLGGR